LKIFTDLFYTKASSKQRSTLRKAISSEKSKLGDCVENYNELCAANLDGANITTSAEEIINGDFPWSSLTG